jgi:hypothetical protein
MVRLWSVLFAASLHASKVTGRRGAATLGLAGLALWGCARHEQPFAPTCLAGALGQPGLDSALAVHRRHTMELMAIPASSARPWASVLTAAR